MTEATVLESGLTPPEFAPNQGDNYAVSMVTLLTRSNPEKAIAEAIDHLVEKREHWERNELQRSNEVLYGMLQHC